MRKDSARPMIFLLLSFTLIGFSRIPAVAQPRGAAASSLSSPSALTLTRNFSAQEQVSAANFFQTYRQALRLSADDELKPISISSDQLGQTHYRYQQYYKGIALADRQFLLHEKDSRVFLAHGEIVSGLVMETTPALSEQQALRLALDHIGAEAYMWEDPGNEAFLQREQNDASATFMPKGELQISAGHGARGPQDFRLVYRFDIYAEKPLGRYDVDVDAKTGAIVKVSSRLYEADVASQGTSVYNGTVTFTADEVTDDTYRLRERGRGNGVETYDMQRTTSFANARDFIDADNNFTDANAQVGVSVHWAAEATYDYYLSKHNRKSYNNANGVIRSYAHFDNNWFNAQWDGSRMRFGDGNNNTTPLVTLDIVAHEFTHGVTQYEAGLIYANESGALNESFSDIFGNAVEFEVLKTEGSWDMGQGAVLIRSMSNPKTLGQPDTYKGARWVPTTNTPNGTNDYGGVHTNSGVQNYWFYLLSEGGSGVNDYGDAYAITPLGLERAAEIAYRNLSTYLTTNSTYQEARLATIYSMMDLYGFKTPEYQTALAAWSAVGVYYPNFEATLVAAEDTVSFVAESAVGKDTSAFEISNQGLDVLYLTAAQISGANFRLLEPTTLPAFLDYGATMTVKVVFTPTAAQVEYGTLRLESNDPSHPATTITLRGKGFAIRPAQAGLVYAIAGRSEQGVFLTLDQNHGQGTAVGATGYDELTGLALRPSNNIIYGTYATSNATTLLRVDAETGEAYAVAVIPVPNLRAIVFDRNDDLFGAQFNSGKLYRIDPVSGDTAAVGNTKISLLSGLAINPIDSSLWAARVGQAIYKLDKTTGASTLVGNSGFARTPEIEFDAAGNLFGLSGFGLNEVSDFLQINPTTGKATKLGTTGFKSVYSLIIRGAITTGVAEQLETPTPRMFALAQNHPNPFNPTTLITFHLPTSAVATLKVFDLAGREVATLVHGKMSAGEHQVHFDASTLAAGVYVYRLEAGEHVAARKLVLVK